jgi:hypothetical protein
MRAAPAAKGVLDAIEVLRTMNADNARKVSADAPTGFIKERWEKLVMTDAGIDRRYCELCAATTDAIGLRCYFVRFLKGPLATPRPNASWPVSKAAPA